MPGPETATRPASTRRAALATAAVLALGAPAATAAGFLVGSPWLLPLLTAAVPFPVFLSRVRRGRYGRAVGWVLFWAVFQSLAVLAATWLAPERAAAVVHRGPAYAAEMIHWVRTGEGAEGSPRLFLPIHLRHYLGFCVLSTASAGAAGLALGAWLLNYMNYYVAELARTSADFWTAALLGWPIWAVIRVAGYVVTGAALAGLSLSLAARIKNREAAIRFPARVFFFGLSLVVADAVIKALLAPAWQKILLRALVGGN